MRGPIAREADLWCYEHLKRFPQWYFCKIDPLHPVSRLYRTGRLPVTEPTALAIPQEAFGLRLQQPASIPFSFSDLYLLAKSDIADIGPEASPKSLGGARCPKRRIQDTNSFYARH